MAAFVGGRSGEWRVERFETVTGAPLEPVTHIRFVEGTAVNGTVIDDTWVLRGVVGNERYVTRVEHEALASLQEPLGRAGSTCAALIPISKAEGWWKLAHDERRRIFEESSRHVAFGLQYLPAIARRLHHARDLGEPLTSSHGSNMHRLTLRHLRNLWESCATPKSGHTSNGRSIFDLFDRHQNIACPLQRVTRTYGYLRGCAGPPG
jgi:hypothetical protein